MSYPKAWLSSEYIQNLPDCLQEVSEFPCYKSFKGEAAAEGSILLVKYE